MNKYIFQARNYDAEADSSPQDPKNSPPPVQDQTRLTRSRLKKRKGRKATRATRPQKTEGSNQNKQESSSPQNLVATNVVAGVATGVATAAAQVIANRIMGSKSNRSSSRSSTSNKTQVQGDREWVSDKRVEGGGYWRKKRNRKNVSSISSKKTVGKIGKEIGREIGKEVGKSVAGKTGTKIGGKLGGIIGAGLLTGAATLAVGAGVTAMAARQSRKQSQGQLEPNLPNPQASPDQADPTRKESPSVGSIVAPATTLEKQVIEENKPRPNQVEKLVAKSRDLKTKRKRIQTELEKAEKDIELGKRLQQKESDADKLRGIDYEMFNTEKKQKLEVRLQEIQAKEKEIQDLLSPSLKDKSLPTSISSTSLTIKPQGIEVVKKNKKNGKVKSMKPPQ